MNVLHNPSVILLVVVVTGGLSCSPCEGQLDCFEKGQKVEAEQGRTAAAPLYLKSCTTGDWDAEASLLACRKYSWATRSPTDGPGPTVGFKIKDHDAWKAVSERLRKACSARKADACESAVAQMLGESLSARNAPDPTAARLAVQEEWCPFRRSLCDAPGASSALCRGLSELPKMGPQCP